MPGRPTIKFTKFMGYLEDGFVAFFLIALIAGVLGLIGFAIASDNNATYSGSRHQLAVMLKSDAENFADQSTETQLQRQQIATQIVAVQDLAAADHVDSLYSLTDYEMDQIRHTAETGDPIVVNQHKWAYASYFRFLYLYPTLLVLWLVLSICLIISYGYALDDQRGDLRLVSLPWRHVWPILFVGCMGPIWWTSMLCSGIRYLFAPPARPNQPLPQPVVVDQMPIRTRAIPDRDIYISAPGVARQVYVDLRSGKVQTRRIERLVEIDTEIDEVKDTSAALAAQLKQKQSQINGLRAESRTIQEGIAAASQPISDQVMKEEFDRIMTLPGVLAVQVMNERLRLIVRAEYTYEGRTYDLGDWQLDFGADTLDAQATPLRIAVRSDWGRGDPNYLLNNGTFCFGDRHWVISEHLAKGQYLEAMALAAECLSSVNPDDVYNVPYAFYEKAVANA